MVLFPTARLVPLTLRDATPFDNAAEPSEVLPIENAMLPVGASEPPAALTVAVSWVVPEDGMLAGLAAAAVVVVTGGAVTAIVTVPVELLKFPVATKVAVMVLFP